jgi:membrane-associated phospholipid phosphatase
LEDLLSQSTAHVAPSRPPAPSRTGLRGIPGLAPVAVVTACITVTGVLADGAVEHGDLAAHDPAVTTWLMQSRTPLLTAAAQVVTTIGSEASIGVLSFLALVWLVLVKRALGSALVLGSSMGTAAVLTVVLKHFVGRPRPPAADVLGPLESSFSFPSGHTLFSTVFFGLVAGLLVARARRGTARALIVLAWVGASGAVGLSRLYLGYHWLTDVVASWTIAVAVLAVAAAGWRLLRTHPLPVPRFVPRFLLSGTGLDGAPVGRGGS